MHPLGGGNGLQNLRNKIWKGGQSSELTEQKFSSPWRRRSPPAPAKDSKILLGSLLRAKPYLLGRPAGLQHLPLPCALCVHQKSGAVSAAHTAMQGKERVTHARCQQPAQRSSRPAGPAPTPPRSRSSTPPRSPPPPQKQHEQLDV